MPPLACDLPLAEDVPVEIAPPLSEPLDSLALGIAAPTSAVVDRHNRSFGFLYSPGPLGVGRVQAVVQGRPYLTVAQAVQRARATRLLAELRTPRAHVDRSYVRVAFQLLDALNNVQVAAAGLVVQMVVSEASSGEQRSVACNTDGVRQEARYFLGFCTLSSLPSSWFTSGGAASVSVGARYGGVEFASIEAGVISLAAQPAWYTNLAAVLPSAGAFAALPASPVYAGESFTVRLFAHTGGNQLESWSVWLEFDSALVEYVEHTQSALFNGVSFRQDPLGAEGSDGLDQRLTFSAVGKQDSSSAADVTGADVPLLSVTLRMGASVPVGAHAELIRVVARQLINSGSKTFVEGRPGVVVDSSSSAQGRALGGMVVKGVTEVGLFAYFQTSTLANFAVLTGEASEYAMTVVATTDDDLVSWRGNAVVPDPLCALLGGDTAVLELRGCTVRLTAEQTRGAALANIAVRKGEALEAVVSFSVYYPASVGVRVADGTLNRLTHADGAPIECDGAQRYQHTSVSAAADGLDVSPVVRFAVDEARVGAIVEPSTLEGLEPGTLRVHLRGRPVAFAFAAVEVSDVGVVAVRLVSRAITSVSWEHAPPAVTVFSALGLSLVGLPAAGFAASVLVAQSLTAEEQTARLHTTVQWDDGFSQDVSAQPPPSSGALNVTSLSPSIELIAPGAGDPFWALRVAQGAAVECGGLVSVEWRMCGARLSATTVPVFLDLPAAVAMSFTASQTRLADPEDDATLPPIRVAARAELHVVVTFDDGSSRSMSSDTRVSFAVAESECARIEGAPSQVGAARGDRRAQHVHLVLTPTCAHALSPDSCPLAMHLPGPERLDHRGRGRAVWLGDAFGEHRRVWLCAQPDDPAGHAAPPPAGLHGLPERARERSGERGAAWPRAVLAGHVPPRDGARAGILERRRGPRVRGDWQLCFRVGRGRSRPAGWQPHGSAGAGRAAHHGALRWPQQRLRGAAGVG